MKTATLPRAPLGRFALAGAAIFALSVSAAFADYRTSYEKGIRAIDNKDWSNAITALRVAAEEKSVEGERLLLYGMRYKPYLPHYYLGLAYFHTGNCEAALKAWAESDRQGAVRQQSEYATLRTLRDQCRGQGAREPAPAPAPTPAPAQSVDVKGAVAEAEAEIRKGDAAAAAVARLRSEPDSSRVWQSDPALRQRESKGNLDLASARSVLAEGRSSNNAARIGAARDAAIRARQELESLGKLVAERRDKLQREALAKEAKEGKEGETRARQAAIEKQAKEKEARERQAALDNQEKERLAKEKQASDLARQKTRTALAAIGLQLREARQLLGDAGRRQPPPDGIARPTSDLQAAVGEAQRAGQATPLAELERLRDRLGKSAAGLKIALNRAPLAPTPAPETGPPAALLEGAAAFFQGEYEKAVRALEGAEFSDPRAAAQARLLRGAARFGVFVTGGEKDERLRQQAVEDVRDCRRLDPKIVVSTRAFSPRFIEFFNASGSPAGS